MFQYLYISENPDVPLPNFKYQDQVQEIMFMGRKQGELLKKLLNNTSSDGQDKTPIMAQTVKFGFDNHIPLQEVGEPFSFNQFFSRIKFVKYMEMENCLNDEHLLTLALTCNHLVKLKISSNLITNQGIHYLAFLDSPCEKGALDDCKCRNKKTKLSENLIILDIRGVRDVNEIGVLIALQAFKALRNIFCRNELLCATLECVAKRNITGENWNPHAIKKLECGLKQSLVYSIFEETTGK